MSVGMPAASPWSTMRPRLDCSIEILPEDRGHAGRRHETINVSLEAGKAGWWSKQCDA